MNLQSCTLGHQHGHAAHLSEFQSYLDVCREEPVFDRTRIRVMALNYFFESVGDAQQPGRESLRLQSANSATFNQAIMASSIFDYAPPGGFTARIDTEDSHCKCSRYCRAFEASSSRVQPLGCCTGQTQAKALTLNYRP